MKLTELLGSPSRCVHIIIARNHWVSSFEKDGDIDLDFPWVDEHGRIILTIRKFDVSQDHCDALLSDVMLQERHSERQRY